MNRQAIVAAVILPCLFLTPAPADDPDHPPIPLSISGQVVDSRGNPMAGATVTIREWATWRTSGMTDEESKKLWEGGRLPDVLARTKTDSEGQFAFKDVAAPAFKRSEGVGTQVFPWDVIATADGHGLAWKHLSSQSMRTPIRLTLSDEGVIRGRLVDPDGKPAAGVRADVYQVAELDQPVRQNDGAEGYLNLSWSSFPLRATSGVDGRFSIGRLPAGVRIGFYLNDDRFERKTFFAASTDQVQPDLVDRTYNSGGRMEVRNLPVYTADFTVQVNATNHVLFGRVLFDDTGEPVPGIKIYRWHKHVATSDDAGRYRIERLAAGKHELHAYAWQTNYAPLDTEVELAAEPLEVQMDLKLPRGVVVTGRVIEEGTDRGVAGACLGYEPPPDGDGIPTMYGISTTTDDDGMFRIVVPRGKGKLKIGELPPGYARENLRHRFPGKSSHDLRFTLELNGQPGQTIEAIEFRVTRGIVVHGQVVDPDGKPVARARIKPVVIFSHQLPDVVSDPEGRFTLSGQEPVDGLEFEIEVRHPERGLGARVTVPIPENPKTPATMKITLQPTASVSGRVLDEEDEPIAGATVHLYSPSRGTGPSGFASPVGNPITVEADGSFTLDGLLPDAPYYFYASAEGYGKSQGRRFEAKSGQEHREPDHVLPITDQSLAGTVVDPDGTPLAGIAVSVDLKNRSITPAGKWFQDTDAVGRFRLTGLPRGNLQLMAYRRPQGPDQVIRGQVYVRAEAGQQDVTITLPDAEQRPATLAAIGKPAPPFPVRTWLNRSNVAEGRGFIANDFKGKIVVLAFLDDTKPSQRLLPRLADLPRTFNEHNLVVIRISEVWDPLQEEPPRSQPTNSLVARVAPGTSTPASSEAFRKYAVRSTPALFLVDRDGRLQSEDIDIKELKQRVEKLAVP